MLDGDGAGEGVEVLEQLADAHLVPGVPVLLPEDVVGGELVDDGGPALRGRLGEQLRLRPGGGGGPRVHHPLEDAGPSLPQRVGDRRVVHPGPQAERLPRRPARVDRRFPAADSGVGHHLDRGVHGVRRRRRRLLARIPSARRRGSRFDPGDSARGRFEEVGCSLGGGGGGTEEGSGEQRRRCRGSRGHDSASWRANTEAVPPAMWEEE